MTNLVFIVHLTLLGIDIILLTKMTKEYHLIKKQYEEELRWIVQIRDEKDNLIFIDTIRAPTKEEAVIYAKIITNTLRCADIRVECEGPFR